MYRKRHLEQTIIRSAKSFPVVLLTGPRQVGKTTLLAHLGKNKKYNYVSLDEFETRSMAKKDPGFFLEQYKPPLIIDEIQYAPQLLPYIKAKVDKLKNISYWLTGSQQFHLMKGVSESLAGRVAVLNLYGFSAAEANSNPFVSKIWLPKKINLLKRYPSINLKKLFNQIIQGSFPRLAMSQPPPLDVFYGSYIQTYIDRDLRDLVRVKSLSNFEKFIRLCAARTGQLLNLSDLSRDSGITVNTAKEWLSLLEASGHIFLLKPYYRNISKRLIKIPKLYFLDTGIVCYLTGWKTAETAMKGAMAGALFETYIISEFIKNYANHGLEPQLWYYRTKEKEEVDIIIDNNGKLYPIEIKLSQRINLDDLKGIKSLEKTKTPLGQPVFITATSTPYYFQKDALVLPYTILNNI